MIPETVMWKGFFCHKEGDTADSVAGCSLRRMSESTCKDDGNDHRSRATGNEELREPREPWVPGSREKDQKQGKRER